MVYKCKICAGSLTVVPKSRIAVCDYCGTKQVLPLFSDESAQLLYDRGNDYLRQNEYNKAENIFNQLIALCPEDPEIYWDLVLCKYGVTFVKDPQTGKYIPTCNRTHFQSVFQDQNYQNAIKYSDAEKAAYFKENAETINNIQKGILSVSKKEKPFDIFISYKETDANGVRTKDSVRAQELYERLTAEGYKVFFSRITLEDKIGTEYEPYIYAALYSSKVMLTVSSTKANIEAAWVKNEWSRFLTLRQNDATKTLIPLYYDMPKSDLPEEFAILSAQDMDTDGFEQELLRGIKKMIPLPIMLAKRRKQLKKRLSIALAVVAGILIAAGIIAYPQIKDYTSSRDAYEAAIALYDNGSYVEAAAAFEEISDFEDASQMKQLAEDAEQERVSTEEYNAAMQLYYAGKYPQAAWAFRDMNGFSDSAEMQKKAEKAWRESVATIAIENIMGSSSQGSYYISANGTVETFNHEPGTANAGIEVNQHGKIVSIAANYSLYALYEDGYVFNSAKNNNMDADWEDIIQISPVFNATNVALKNDGTLVYGDIQDQWNPGDTDSWLEEISDWKNIVSISWDFSRYGTDGLMYAMLVGVDADGNVYSVSYCSEYESDGQRYMSVDSFLSDLKNIQKVSIYLDLSRNPLEIYAAALDDLSILHTYAAGEIGTIESVSDFEANMLQPEYIGSIFVTDSKRKLSVVGSDKTILEDVVYFNKYYAVTQSGTIYRDYNLLSNTPVATEAKTEVKDVWLGGN